MALIQLLGVQTLVSLMAAERRGGRAQAGGSATKPAGEAGVSMWLHDSRAAFAVASGTGSNPAMVVKPNAPKSDPSAPAGT